MSLRKLIKEKLGIVAKLRWGGLGELDVLVEGKTVFSYKQAGHMPGDEEILGLISKQA